MVSKIIQWLKSVTESIKDAWYWSRTEQRIAEMLARMPQTPEEWEAERQRDQEAEEAWERIERASKNIG